MRAKFLSARSDANLIINFTSPYLWRCLSLARIRIILKQKVIDLRKMLGQ